jgi:pyruvate kinase
MRRTKIVCTIGPSSNREDILREMILSGMDVARLNFSHATHAEHRKTLQLIRRISEELDRPVAILQDIAGPKIRIGKVKNERITLHAGETVNITTAPAISTREQISVNYPQLISDVKQGDTILLADGSIQLEVNSVEDDIVKCTVVEGGILTSHKGVNLPSVTLQTPTITEKDRDDIIFGVKNNVDYIAISFIRAPEDLHQARKIIADAGGSIPVIAKIEKHEAVRRIEEIIAASDGVMVARGDLGVEIPLEEVPLIQKKIIRLANLAGKPVITATQMLRSMVEKNRPTRAETTDISNAILDGTDAIMLSEETANGNYPLQSLQVMSKIAQVTEASEEFTEQMQHRKLTPPQNIPDAISHAACSIAESLNAAAILTPTRSGNTARLIARYRPKQPIIALCTNQKTRRQLNLIWGVHPEFTEATASTDQVIRNSKHIAKQRGLKTGDLVVITAGMPAGTPGTTNLIKVSRIE